MHEIFIPWDDRNGTLWWNETCAKVIEHFGLPGGKYTSHPTEDSMSFIFYNDKDALLCRILLSDRL
jgi:hypothetical protein